MNSKAFTPEEVEKDLHLDLIKYLLGYNKKSEEHYYEIRISTDGFCTIVDWIDRRYDHDFSEEKFELVDEDHQIVAEEVRFPDNHYELVYPECKKEAINDWIKDNPEWEIDECGVWHRVDNKEVFEF